MEDNLALWLPVKRGNFVVGPAPVTSPGPHEIAVRVRAVAVNPFDRYVQAIGDIILGYLSYPAVLGTDVAGDVLAVGEGVTRFRVGDRILGHAAGLEKCRNRAAEGAFQQITLLLDHMSAPIPEAMTYEQAAVLPLGLSTAACGLFQKDFMALRAPRLAPEPTNEVVLVWGGSTSVGSNAIQLARAAGYDVVTTCSPRNFDYAQSLGAEQAFDYHNASAVSDLVRAMQKRPCAGALSIGQGSAAACLKVLGAVQGPRFLAQATPPTSFDSVPAGRSRASKLVPAITSMVTGNLLLNLEARRKRIPTAFIWGGSLIGNEVGPMIYRDFLPEALAQGRYRAAPEPDIVGHGLGAIPTALERQRGGVSARKLVVSL